MKIITIIVLLVLAVGIIGLYILGRSESHSNRFSSYEEAKESELIAKGWIPSFIPISSYNIKERHRVDYSYISVELDFDPKDITAFKQSCSLISKEVFKCDNSGHPVSVIITNGNHAIIESVSNDT